MEAMEEKEMREMLEDLTFKVNELYYGQIGVDEHLKNIFVGMFSIKDILESSRPGKNHRQEMDLRQLSLF